MPGEVEVDDPLRVGVADADHVGRIVRGRDVIERADRRADADSECAALVVDQGERGMVRIGFRGDAIEQSGQIGRAGRGDWFAVLLSLDRHGIRHVGSPPPPNA